MPLKEEFVRSGDWLFRRRSYLPLVLALIFALGILYGGRRIAGAAGTGRALVCLAVSSLGLALRIFTVGHAPAGTSGRNTEGQIAEVLNSTGMYSVVRHPLYLGNFFMWLGISMYSGLWWAVVVTILIFEVYYERIMFAEEEFLRGRFGEDYENWARNTPAFFPHLRKWKKPQLPFSARNVLKREYSGFFAMICSFTFIDVLLNLEAKQGPAPNLFWRVAMAAGLVIYIVLRTLKKKTRLLSVDGR